MGRVKFNHSFLVCKLPTSADGIIGLNFLTPRQAKLDLGSFSLSVCLNTNLDFAASSRHETLLEECKRREWRGLITHVSISHNPSRGRSVESGCIKSTRKDNNYKMLMRKHCCIPKMPRPSGSCRRWDLGGD